MRGSQLAAIIANFTGRSAGRCDAEDGAHRALAEARRARYVRTGAIDRYADGSAVSLYSREPGLLPVDKSVSQTCRSHSVEISSKLTFAYAK